MTYRYVSPGKRNTDYDIVSDGAEKQGASGNASAEITTKPRAAATGK